MKISLMLAAAIAACAITSSASAATGTASFLETVSKGEQAYAMFNNVVSPLLEVYGDNGLLGTSKPMRSPDVTSVPEPQTWALMIGGFGFTGAALRRRRGASLSAA